MTREVDVVARAASTRKRSHSIGGVMHRKLSLHVSGRTLLGGALLAAATTAVLIGVPAVARGGEGSRRLDAKVLVTNPGPLTACSAEGSCTAANSVLQYIRIENGNALLNQGRQAGATRADVPNAFVVSSIEEAVFVNGVQDHDFDFTYTPPPNPSLQSYSGHWLVSVTCPPEGPPCTNVASNPAVLPGEETSVLWTGWAHGADEPNGTYVFTFTIHGTLNDNPVDLTTSTPPIVMTP